MVMYKLKRVLLSLVLCMAILSGVVIPAAAQAAVPETKVQKMLQGQKRQLSYISFTHCLYSSNHNLLNKAV